ncbi:hypothetical protein Ancab_019944 [Ancistrocladus abbreviatus]
MARVGNSFALLLDEEGDDMTVLVEHITKKVELSTPLPATAPETKGGKNPHSQHADAVAPAGGKHQGKSFPSAENVRGDRGRARGGQGRGYRRGGYGGNDADQFGNGSENGYRRNNYNGDSYGNGFDGSSRGRGRGRGGGRGGGHGRGRGRSLEGGFHDDSGLQNEEVAHEGEGNLLAYGGEGKQVARSGDAGWESVPQSHAKGYRNGGHTPVGDQRTYGNGYQSYGVDRKDGNQNYNSDRRVYGGGQPRARRDGMSYRMVEQSDNEEVKEAVNKGDKEIRNENNDHPEQNDFGVSEVPKDTETEEEKREEITKEDAVKNDGKEEEEANYMTLDEYEKLLLEKRKALEALKAKERKVTLDKDLEAMQLVEKKKEETIFIKLQQSDKEKLKKKESLDKEDKARKSVSINEFLKPADGEEQAYRRSGGRGRGRGRGRGEQRGGGAYKNVGREQQGGDVYRQGGGRYNRDGGGYERGRRINDAPAISIEDPGQFPVLGGGAVKA